MKRIPEKIVEEINNYISAKRDECNLLNEVVREDVFQVLQSQCTVLYYDLDDTIEGCHIFKPVNGELRQFVFINTNKNVQEQVWTAAHELGHVWKVDKHIEDVFGREWLEQYDSEFIVGRFAAEFLMPERIFRQEVLEKIKHMSYNGSDMKAGEMMKLIAYLMNYFCTPYKSVVLRFIELGYIDEKDRAQYMKYENDKLLLQVIEENQYSRLGKERSVFAMENFPEELQEAENRGVLSEKKINKIRELLHIKKQETGEEELGFKGIVEK